MGVPVEISQATLTRPSWSRGVSVVRIRLEAISSAALGPVSASWLICCQRQAGQSGRFSRLLWLWKRFAKVVTEMNTISRQAAIDRILIRYRRSKVFIVPFGSPISGGSQAFT